MTAAFPPDATYPSDGVLRSVGQGCWLAKYVDDGLGVMVGYVDELGSYFVGWAAVPAGCDRFTPSQSVGDELPGECLTWAAAEKLADDVLAAGGQFAGRRVGLSDRATLCAGLAALVT